MAPHSLRLSEILSAMSCALDITEGQPEGHAVRTCLIGMRLADTLALSAEDRSALFYALLLKDLGCSANASRLCAVFQADDISLKRHHKVTDWTNSLPAALYALRHAAPSLPAFRRPGFVLTMATKDKGAAREMTATRCDRGSEIARMLELPEATAIAIRNLDEHFDGRGLPDGLVGEEIPLLGRILCLAQTMEVFARTWDVKAAMSVVRERKGRWFDPRLVDALRAFERDATFWTAVYSAGSRNLLEALEPADRVLEATPDRVDRVAHAFARVIDAKSPYTYHHSEGVAAIADATGSRLGLTGDERIDLRHAALLHDIGKLGVSNLILDKPGKLTDEEQAAVRRHPAYTVQILERVGRFRHIAEIAGQHHERLDGRGYHRGLKGEHLGRLARIIAVADVCEALLADRPYRAGLPMEQVLSILRQDAGTALCPDAVDALELAALAGVVRKAA